jgi:syntaxin 5
MDRTKEFAELARTSGKSSSAARSNVPAVKSQSAFNEAAAEIARGVHKTSQVLAKLTKLVQSQGLFDDPTEEINRLIFRIKQELGELNSKCDSAQQYVDGQKRGLNSGVDTHHTNVVGYLKTGLAHATKDFKSILEVRSHKIKDQQNRKKELTGGGVLSPMRANAHLGAQNKARAEQMAASNPFGNNNLPYGMNQRRGGQGAAVSDPYARVSGASLYADPSTRTTDAGEQMHDNNNSEGANSLAQMEEQQLLLAPPTQYFEDRIKAADEIESTIGELGQLFRRLTTMIHEQQEMVERIDEDIENAVGSVDQAHGALQKAYDAASSNRALYVKLGGILALFFLFFTVFLM